MYKLFTQHPHNNNESYWQHLYHALGYSIRFAWLAIAVGIHAFLPFLFIDTGSRNVKKIHEHITNRLSS